MRHSAGKFGTSLGVLILLLLLVGTVALAPCLVSAEDDAAILFEQLPGSGGTLWLSNKASGMLCFDDFWDLSEDICDVHWYGASTGLTPADCDPTGMKFEIKFYQDSGGTPNIIAPVATFSNVSPQFAPWGTVGPGTTVYLFDVDLGTCVQLTSGWVSIQSTSSPNNCVFTWLSSPDGNTNAVQLLDFVGPPPIPLGVNLAFALTGKPPAPTPSPQGVPAINQWGMVAMIALFAGLLAWAVRRRRPAL